MARRGRKSNNLSFEQKPSVLATGHSYQPLNDAQTQLIAQSAIQIMCEIGFSEYSVETAQVLVDAGCFHQGQRIHFTERLIKDTLSQIRNSIILCGRRAQHDMKVGGLSAYVGTGGAAPNIFDNESNSYRPSTLSDLFNSARLCEQLDNIQFFSRSLVARDMPTPRDLDINTLFACLLGTEKHIMTSVSDAKHIPDIAEICYAVAGSEAKFRARPFVSLNINHIVPPLRFHTESFEVMQSAIAHGFPVHANVFGQLGASSPVTTAGSVAQTLAEALAGVVFAYCVDPNVQVIAGPRSMITDLRTGGFSGGSGEQSLATAMCAQVMRHWNLPCSAIAGATDSKSTDAQSGFEKAMTVTTAIQSGSNLVTQAAGTQAGLMGASLQAYIIDNDMLGAILRANVIPEVTTETLAIRSISEVVNGDGHFLGQAETYQRMKSDFLYPEISDRRTIDEWATSEKISLEDQASAIVVRLLAKPPTPSIDAEILRNLITRFDLAFEPLSLTPLKARAL